MEMIHILDGKTEHIIATLENKGELVYWDDSHKERDDNGLNQYDFTTIDGTEIAAMLVPGNKIVIRDLDGNFIPFNIVRQEQKKDGSNTKRIMTDGEHIELRKAKIIEPTELTGFTLNDALDFVLGGTRWKRGITDYTETATIRFDKYINALEALQMIRSVFSVNLRFRAEIQGNRIVARYVDAIKPDDVFDGKEITFGKDIVGVRRFEDHRELYTMLLGVGPADENGNYITIESVNNGDKYLRDEAAIQRWGELRGVFEYQPEQNEKVSPTLLKQKTQEALKNSINSYMTYEVDTIALENIPGFEHEKVRKGMTVRIKDEMFNPPLYLEARVLETERSYTSKNGKFIFGNYRTVNVVKDKTIARLQAKLFKNENVWSSSARVIRSATPPDDVHAIWIDITKNPEVPMTYDFTANEWKKASPTVAEEIGAETPTGAQQKADAAKQEAKNYADVQDQSVYQDSTYYADVVSQNAAAIAENNAKNYTNTYAEKKIAKGSTAPSNPGIGDLWIDTSVTPNLLKRWTGNAWQKLAPTTAAEIGAVSLSTYTQKVQEIENNIAEKADAEWVNGQLVLKANASDVYTKTETDNKLGTKADKSTTYTKTEVDNALNSKVSITTYTADKDGIVQQLDNHESRITQTEEEIATKVSNTTYQQDKTALENDISSLETRMATAESSITQTANAIQLKANKTDVYTKTEVDSSLATKADNSTVSAIEQRVTQAEAQLNIQADQIASKVSRTEFEGLKIGGRNLHRLGDFKEVDTSKYPFNWIGNRSIIDISNEKPPFDKALYLNGASGFTYTLFSGEEAKQFLNKTFTVSFWAKYSNVQLGANSWNHLRFGEIYYQYKKSDGTLSYAYPRILTATGTDEEWKYYSGQITLDGYGNAVEILQINVKFLLEGVSNGEGWVTGIKIEEGNKATDWTPAPEDVQGQIDGLGTRLSTAESSITQLSNQITLKVSQSQYDIDMNDLTSRMTSAESTITQLADEIELRVEKNGVISAINQTAEQVKIQASKIALDGYVEAKHIKSLNGLNINNKFIVDGSGNVTFAGTLNGASGTFTGAIKTSGTNGSITIENDTIKQVLGDENATFGVFQRAYLTSGKITVEEIYKDGAYENIEGQTTIDTGYIQGINGVGETFDLNPYRLRFGKSAGTLMAEIDFDSYGQLNLDAQSKVRILKALDVTGDIYAGSGVIKSTGYQALVSGSDGWYFYTDYGAGTKNYLKIKDDGAVFIVVNGAIKHSFYASGTKSGGSIIIDGKNLGMSPIDSPQILLEYIEFDVPLTLEGTKVYIEERFLKAVANFSVFSNNGQVIEKGYDYFVIAGEGTADVRIIGKRAGYTDHFFEDLDNLLESEEISNEN
jgi:phage minor structural protein